MAGARRLADEIRVGLEEKGLVQTQAPVSRREPKDPLNELWFGKPVGQHVREFGALFGAICFFVTAVKLYQGRSTEACLAWGAAGSVFALSGYMAPRLLLPLWRGWMKLAHYLSIVMTSVILVLVWSIGFLPMAFILRIVGIKRMDLSYKAERASYWETRDAKYDDFKRLELQY